MAAQLGRIEVGGNVNQYNPVAVEYLTRWSVEGSIGFYGVDWDVGPWSFSDRSAGWRLGAVYMTAPDLDLRVSLGFLGVTDDDVINPAGVVIEPSIDMIKVGAGVRYWLQRSGRFPIFAGAGVAYWKMDGDQIEVDDGAIALNGEVGITYAIDPYVSAAVALQGDTSIVDAQARMTPGEPQQDLSVTSIGVEASVVWRF
jgi:hypothetical protein